MACIRSYATSAPIEPASGIWQSPHKSSEELFAGVGMLPKSMFVLVLGALAATSTVVPAMASDTGLATTLHDVRREGGRLCMTDHWHYGSSSGQSSKAAAQRAAVVSWQDFTDLEYGSVWARFSRAASRKMGCSHSGGGWGCDAEARPCR
jgi:hypothetical protein